MGSPAVGGCIIQELEISGLGSNQYAHINNKVEAQTYVNHKTGDMNMFHHLYI